jgi:hypothetical protein
MSFLNRPDALARFCLMLVSSFLCGGSLRAAPSPGTFAAEPTLRVLTPQVLEIEWERIRRPDGAAGTQPWDLVISGAGLESPALAHFEVTAGGRAVGVASVGLKRRALSAPLNRRELRVATCLYLLLKEPAAEGTEFSVRNPDGTVWPAALSLHGRLDPQRTNAAIHVNQEGYASALPKKAMVGYYLGSAGEMKFDVAAGFQLENAAGRVVFSGPLKPRPDASYAATPAPYRQVYEADFGKFQATGEFRLVVPGLGASPPFRIGGEVALDFARAYALGIYHQRCGTTNALPFTRFVHDACHLAPATVPVPARDFPFTWKTLAQVSSEGERAPGQTAPVLSGEAAQLFPFVRTGAVDVAGGHHDAGDYSKYTINSASFVHALVFAVDSLPGAADLDNLGLPESGDGISDLLQEAKWEVDFLAKLQDDDGGFYFLVYPRARDYENNVTPDHGDPQVVWP